MRRVAQALWLMGLALLAAAWLLLETLQFKLVLTAAAAAVALVGFPFPQPPRRRVRQGAAAVVLGAALVVWALLPPRRSDPRARVQSFVLDPHGRERPYPMGPYLADVVPDSEIVRLSTLLRDLVPLPAGTILTEELNEQGRLDNPFVREYRHLRRRGLDRGLHSAHALQLAQQLGAYRELRHSVLILPEEKSPRPVPLVIFLHGFMGNFQFYTSMLSELPRVAVLIPSAQDLMGRFTTGDIERILAQDLPEVERRVPIDRGALHLMGLSNGGSGVNAALRSHPRTFRTYTFLSTIIQPDPPALSRGKTIGVIYGTRDGMAENNLSMVRALRADGHEVEAWPFEGERHFVMLTRRKEVLDALRRIISGRRANVIR